MKIVNENGWYRKDNSEFWEYVQMAVVIAAADIFLLSLILR